MQLSLEDAVRVTPWLPTGVRARLSGRVIDGPERVALFVRIACEVGSDRQLWVDADGALEEGGEGAISPEQTEKQVLALFEDPSKKAAVKALDKALQAALSDEERGEVLARTVYAAGKVYELDLADAEPE